MQYRVFEGKHFRKTVEKHCNGLPHFERYLAALKVALATDPFIGEQFGSRVQRYGYEMKTGTLDWFVLMDYFVHEDSVELIQVLPIRS